MEIEKRERNTSLGAQGSDYNFYFETVCIIINFYFYFNFLEFPSNKLDIPKIRLEVSTSTSIEVDKREKVRVNNGLLCLQLPPRVAHNDSYFIILLLFCC